MQSEEEENFYDSLAEVAPANSGGDFEDGVSGVFGYFFSVIWLQ